MVPIVSNDGQTRWEKPLSSTDSVDPAAVDFISGDFPPMVANPMPVFEGDTIVPGTVMVLLTLFSGPLTGQTGAASMAFVETLEEASSSGALGVAVSGVTLAGAGKSVLVAKSGVFDPDLLIWPESVPSEEWKLTFFGGNGAQIILRKRVASAP